MLPLRSRDSAQTKLATQTTKIAKLGLLSTIIGLLTKGWLGLDKSMMYRKPKILQIAVLDYFLTSTLTNTFWVSEVTLINLAYMYFRTICTSDS